jgi:DNA-binding CsgD family transcriptional regulator
MKLQPNLSPQELKVLAFLGEGLISNTAIGLLMHLSPHTIKNHKESLKAKLSLRSCQELLCWAVKNKSSD